MRQQFIALLFTRLIASALQAVVFVALGRMAGVAEFGVIGAIIGLSQFVMAFSDLGMSTYVAKERSNDRTANVLAGLSLNRRSSALFGVLTASVILCFGFLLSYPLVFCLLGIAVALERNTESSLAVAFADQDKTTPALSVGIRRLSAAGAFFLLVAIDMEAGVSYCAAALLAGILGQVHLRIWLRRRDLRYRKTVSLRLTMKAGMPYLASNAASQVRTLDVTIVAIFSSNVSAGLYSAAARITTPLLLVPAAFTSIVMPHVSRATPREARGFARRMVLAFVGSYVALLPLMFWAGPLIILLFGDSFADAAAPLAIMLGALPWVALSSPLGTVLQAHGEQHLVGVNGIVFAVITVSLLILGATTLGAIGAACALLISYALKCGSLISAIERRLR